MKDAVTCSGTPSLLADSEFIRLGFLASESVCPSHAPAVLGGGVDVAAGPELSTSGDVS